MSPIVNSERTNQRLSAIHSLPLLRFYVPKAGRLGQPDRRDGLLSIGGYANSAISTGFCPAWRSIARGVLLTSRVLKREHFRRISYDPCPNALSPSPGAPPPARTSSSSSARSCGSPDRGWDAATTGRSATATSFRPSVTYPPSSSGVTGWSRRWSPCSSLGWRWWDGKELEVWSREPGLQS